MGSEATKEKLFFFWSQEWQEQLLPANNFTFRSNQSRVPTANEANGIFSRIEGWERRFDVPPRSDKGG